MAKRLEIGTIFKSRQQGAVAIIVALCLVVLVGMLALVLDLGHLYVAKTELQNAADASALSGAKELNGTFAGVSKAKAAACEVGNINKFDLSSQPVANKVSGSCTNLTLWVGDCPEDTCMTLIGNIATNADAAGKVFMKVDTGSRTLNTWFAPIWNVMQTKTFGMAVAGPEVTNVAPMGICAIDKNTPGDGINSYYGFDKGVAYNLASINDLLVGLGKGTPLWLHPTASTYEQCKDEVSFASNSKFSSYLCLGKSAAGASNKVFANTGWEANQEGAINTRFRTPADTSDAKFAGMSPQYCAPDKNVNQFLYPTVSGSACQPANCTPYKTASDCNKAASCSWDGKAKTCNPVPVPSGCATDVDWLTYTPTQQGATLSAPLNDVIADTRGNSVVATYAKPTDTSILNNNYPATSSPYQAGVDGTTKYYEAPYTATGVTPTEGRRLLNLVIVNCSSGLKLSGVCEELPKLGVGQFFMPVKADLNSTTKAVYLEFVREIPTTQESLIKLYK